MTPASTDVKRKTGDGRKAETAGPLSAEELRKMHAYWRAANYLSVGQIYLMDNPLLKEPLQLKHISRACSATGEPRRARTSSMSTSIGSSRSMT